MQTFSVTLQSMVHTFQAFAALRPYVIRVMGILNRRLFKGLNGPPVSPLQVLELEIILHRFVTHKVLPFVFDFLLLTSAFVRFYLR